MSARILFVEDDALVRHGLARVLVANGHDVRACGSVAEALREAPVFDPEVLLLDVGLPDGDGISCARQLRERGFDGALVFLTARGERPEVDAAVAQGAHAYLVKPITGAQLLPALETALATARSAHARQQALMAALRDSREISTAVGALAQRDGCTPEEAFEQLRRQARSGGRKLAEVAADVLQGMGAPPLGKGGKARQ